MIRKSEGADAPRSFKVALLPTEHIGKANAHRVARGGDRCVQGAAWCRCGHTRQGALMDKWRMLENPTVARITVSAATLIAVAALVGAGYKWA